MLIVQVCVGSSCHLKGAPEIVKRMQERISDANLESEILLCGSFCTGKCNRIGVTIAVGDAIHTGITTENFRDFWDNTLLPAVSKAKEEPV